MTPPTLGPKFEDALLFAVRTHDGDVRKGTEIPYVSHLLSVCALVLEDGGDEDEAIAALLHDTLEDHARRSDEVRPGASLRCPEWRTLSCSARTRRRTTRAAPRPIGTSARLAYVERIREETYPLCRVALADKLHNTRCHRPRPASLRRRGLGRFNATKEDELRYHRALVEAFREAGAPDYLVDELDSLVRELETS